MASSEEKIDQFTRRKIKGKLKGNKGALKENKGKLKGNKGKLKGNLLNFWIFRNFPKMQENGQF